MSQDRQSIFRSLGVSCLSIGVLSAPRGVCAVVKLLALRAASSQGKAVAAALLHTRHRRELGSYRPPIVRAIEVAMGKLNEPPQNLERRIRELEDTAQTTRLEAMRLAASIITKMDEALVTMTVEAVNTENLSVLQLRHASLMKKAEDLQAKIDRLRADQYDRAYRS
jgi:hypothetical protein